MPPSTSTTLAPVDFDAPFTLGVASGDPDATSVVLWTRLAPAGPMPDADVAVRWELSATETFDDLLAAGDTQARAADAHSVHVVVPIDADDDRFYRFRVGQHTSPVGRTRRAPSVVDSVTFASASCQNYEHGYYAAHRDLAAQAPAFVVWLGDYIYEGNGDTVVRSHDGPTPTDLAGYRQRYAQYKGDVDLQAAHHACPWFVVWDDHEVVNNYTGAEAADATFAARRAAAYRAWWEHQPVRLPAPTALDIDPGAEYRIYRNARWGSLLGIALLDGRQYRSAHACSGPTDRSNCPGIDDAARTMLGADQERWLAGTFGSWGTTWNVLGNQTVLTSMTFANAVLNPDQWDGYPAAQRRLLDTLAATSNNVVLTGDIHVTLAGRLHVDDRPVGVELVATSISSRLSIDAGAAQLVRLLPDIADADVAHRGYLLHTVTPGEWRTELRAVDDATRPDASVAAGGHWRIEAGSNTVNAT